MIAGIGCAVRFVELPAVYTPTEKQTVRLHLEGGYSIELKAKIFFPAPPVAQTESWINEGE